MIINHTYNMQLLFSNPSERIIGERRSKLLLPNSELYAKLKLIQIEIAKYYNIDCERMDLHVELLHRREDSNNIQLQHSRCKILHGKTLRLNDPKEWGFIGKAFCLFVGQLPDYNAIPHVTVAYFGDYVVTPELLAHVRSIVHNLIF